MDRQRKIFTWAVIVSVLLFLSVGATTTTAGQKGHFFHKKQKYTSAYEHVEILTEEIGVRVAGTDAEVATANYISNQFSMMGYAVIVQPFSFEIRGIVIHSQNIIAVKPGKRDRTVILGAHYDSVSERSCDDGNISSGAGDNASGVGVMLAAAQALSRYRTHNTVKFIAFGAEEMGLRGSDYYASQMSAQEIEDTVAMINLDSVGVGDFFYVYAGLDDNPGWVRDLALILGKVFRYDLRTSPQSEYFDWGTTGDWSDHVPFKDLGIPIAYFEWMNWDIEPDGGIETEEYGWIMHTCMDNLDFISRKKVKQTADVVKALVYALSKPEFRKWKHSDDDHSFSNHKQHSYDD